VARARASANPSFLSDGLLVRVKGKVYFIQMPALNEYRLALSQKEIAEVAQYFKTLPKKYLVDAAIIPMMHTMEGAD
jgi:hypothetical protein